MLGLADFLLIQRAQFRKVRNQILKFLTTVVIRLAYQVDQLRPRYTGRYLGGCDVAFAATFPANNLQNLSRTMMYPGLGRVR